MISHTLKHQLMTEPCPEGRTNKPCVQNPTISLYNSPLGFGSNRFKALRPEHALEQRAQHIHVSHTEGMLLGGCDATHYRNSDFLSPWEKVLGKDCSVSSACVTPLIKA